MSCKHKFIVKRSVWPYPYGYGTCCERCGMVLDAGLSKDIAQQIVDHMNSMKSKLYCRVMNAIDFRYWGCSCGYEAPYGKVIAADCKKHGG